MVLAKGAHRAVSKGLNQTGLNTPNGRAWSKHFGPVLRANPWLAEIHPTIRSRLMDCWENREAIETWLDGLDPKERIRLNHPTNVLAKWQKEFGLVEPKPKKKSAAEEQQEANLELHDQLDALFGKLEVDNFDRAKEQLDRLIKEGAIIQVAAEPELAKEITRLKGELSVTKYNLHTARRAASTARPASLKRPSSSARSRLSP
jgi:hypothetical protein